MWRWRRRTDEDFREEIHTNIALDTDRFAAEGMSHEDARTAAVRAFGNVTAAQERFYESRRVMWLDDLQRDVRYALRGLNRSRGFAAVAILTLAVGIGANTSIFSLVNALILRSLPVDHPEQLVEMVFKYPRDPWLNLYRWKDYERFRNHNHVFSDLIAMSPARFQVTDSTLGPELVDGVYVSGNFFDALGLRPAIGRLIGPPEDHIGSARAAVAVISWSYWENGFNLDPAVRASRWSSTMYRPRSSG
jgi:macrolide transport system ATP-binding/permease protein